MPSDKTPVFQEALIEVAELRKIAKKDAEKAIMEKVSTVIDLMIDKEISGVPTLLEQEEPTPVVDQPPAAAAPMSVPVQPPMPATAPMEAPLAMPTGAMGTAEQPPMDMTAQPTEVPATQPVAPEAAPVGSPMDLAIPVPGADGKITVDLEALFNSMPADTTDPMAVSPESVVPSMPEQPSMDMSMAPAATEMPAATAPVQTAPDALAAAPAPVQPEEPMPLAESFKRSLKSFEKELRISSSKGLSEINKELMTNKLLSLFEIAQGARETKEISDKLLNVYESTMEALFESIKKSGKQDNSYNRQTTNNKKEEKEMGKKDSSLKDFAKRLFEGVEAKGHAGFGDGGAAKEGVQNTTTMKDETAKKKSGDAGGVKDPGKEDSLHLPESVDESQFEADLMEMLSGLDEEGTDMMEAGHDGDEVSMKESLQKRLASLKEEQEKLTRQLKECGMDMDGGANVNVKITVDTTDGSVEDVSVTKGDEVGMEVGSDDSSLMAVGGDDDEIEIDLESDDEGDDEEEVEVSASDDESEDKGLVAESRKNRQLAETQMFAARALYVAKIFAENNLSKVTKQKIVEYIDSANTVEEAKTKYARIKKMLSESNKPSGGLKGGSSSKPSAAGKPILSESANGLGNLEMSPTRWMQLAGIKK